jgi:hypothetical protein
MIVIVKKAHYEETAHIIKLNTEAVQNVAFLPKGQYIIKKSQQDFQRSAKEAIKTLTLETLEIRQ